MWKDLSMSERAAFIKLGVDNGVYDINEIRDSYNKYKDGGYKPSVSIRRRISDWEGPQSMKVNRSFEDEARDFNAALPKGATSRLSQSQLDGLYSYSYNVGAGAFRSRVVPTLTRYLAGQATIQDVQNSMWASKDSKYRGLAKRRNIERAMLGNYNPRSYNPINFNPVSKFPTMLINQPQPEEIKIPELKFSEAFSNPIHINLESSSPYNSNLVSESSEDEDSNELVSSLTNITDMLQSIRGSRKVNIHI